MPQRQFASADYRYGFNGKENDNEVKGTSDQQDYGMRIYDTRLVRFLSVDPFVSKFPFYSPFQFAGNKLISCIDLDGLENVYYDTDFKESSVMEILNSSEAHCLIIEQFQNVIKTDNDQNVNVGWDILFIKGEEPIRGEGRNFNIIGGHTVAIPKDQMDNFNLLKGYEKIIESIKNDPSKKGVIVVVIRQENINYADAMAKKGEWHSSGNVATDTDHELLLHALNYAFGINIPDKEHNKKTAEEHKEGYSEPGGKQLPENEIEPSPDRTAKEYPNSKMGKIAIEHNKIAEKLKIEMQKFAPSIH